MTTLFNQVSTERLFAYLDGITDVVRLSGSPAERQAFAFIEEHLRELGFTISRYESDALVGFPGAAAITINGDPASTFDAHGYSLSPATGPAGVTAEVVDLGAGAPADFADRNLAGKIVLSDGMAMPPKARAAARAGAAGHLHVDGAAPNAAAAPTHGRSTGHDERGGTADPGSYTHEMCISPVWGMPLPETAGLLPSVPAVAILPSVAGELRHRLRHGPVSVTLVTAPFRGWVRLPTLIADLPARESADGAFVLFSGHVDSWHYGVMDNGTANATQIEVGRLLAARRDELRRGLRLAFWSGHSHGRYAGSAWYADAFWQELHDRCVCHVNIDSVGATGASVLGDAAAMAETYGFGRAILAETAGASLAYRRISRSSDQSFWGHGIPSLFAALSEQPRDDTAGTAAFAQLLGAGDRGGGGLGWWWHTPHDTRDKIDPANFTRDAGIYAETLWRLCTLPRLPFDCAAGADEIAGAAATYARQAAAVIDLSETVTLARSLAAAIRALPWATLSDAAANALIVALNQTLIPVNYTRTGPFHHDLALPADCLPGLSAATAIARLPPGSDAYHFSRAELRREQNRIHAALHAARRLVARAADERRTGA